MNRREVLIQMAIQRDVESTVANAALNDVNRDAIAILISRMQEADDSAYIVRKYVDEIMRSADEQNRLLEIADLLITVPNNSLGSMVQRLSRYDNRQKVIGLLRQIVAVNWASERNRMYGAEGIFQVTYNRTGEALQDENDLVRIVAVRHFEQNHDISSLTQALQNSTPEIRRIAAWYMGQRKVAESSSSLLHSLSVETDTETLRAIIWSVGILKISEAKPELEKLLHHESL
ncbi:MAG: HEAT repeat domain-containing protein [Anaerolineae bacterium]|nr:HEAT repeat domain-containing protein [Anaerolineae bacterium]